MLCHSTTLNRSATYPSLVCTFPYNYFLPFFVIDASAIFTAMIAIMGDILPQQYSTLEITGHNRYDNTKAQGLISSNNINRKSHVYGRLNDDINSQITWYSRDSTGNSVFGCRSRSRGASAIAPSRNQEKHTTRNMTTLQVLKFNPRVDTMKKIKIEQSMIENTKSTKKQATWTTTTTTLRSKTTMDMTIACLSER